MPSLIKRGFQKLLTPLLWNRTSAEVRCANISFSQFGEDVMCDYLFPNGFKGFYVDVGAFHPMTYSNTYGLYRKGWRGLEIDANPDVAALFARFRPEDIFIHSAVGRETGSIEMALFEDGAFNCTVDQMDKVPERLRRNVRRMQVPIHSLAALLAGKKVQTVDFLSIDCEGNDLNVLQSNDWSRWKPKVVCVEDHAFDWQQSEIVAYLESVGYILKFRAVFSSIFVPKETAHNVQADSLHG
ncbi:MAG TPA: FkbM family methyltransferase [Verrucomicrobiae bacterium]|jgi:FkbM family methyltransferase